MGSQVNPWNLVSAAQYVEVKTSLTIYSPIHAPPSLILTAGAPQGYVLGPALFSLIHTARQHTHLGWTTMVRVCSWMSRVHAGLFRPSEYMWHIHVSVCSCVCVQFCVFKVLHRSEESSIVRVSQSD